ncbi:MAG: ParB N-terminal domain-containing protein [Planctomycetes bacterium]|nr:ParB N-terminal domain-containing protein [Planctomycetota bacterium]
MKHKKVKWKTEHRPLSELKPHPKNVIFADLSDAALDELASDMDAHGQEHPIDILPDGTVIGGHQRLRAARRLGWKTIRCRVRFDLAAAGEVAIEEFLLRDNLLRRQLDPIEVARVYRRLKELAKNNGRAFKGDVRDLIAKRFGKSGRTLDRWLRLLDTPLEVQNAVIAGTLRLVDGGKVADLPEDLREEIADRLRSGQAPKKAVSKYIGNRSTKPVNVGTLLSRLVRDVKGHSVVLGDRVEEIKAASWVRDLKTLREAHELISRICARIEKNAARIDRQDIVNHYRDQGDEE